ncbi:MAG: hypothetical protein GXP43_02370 [bacterium]|nr:hypothetical protein [bacterium]
MAIIIKATAQDTNDSLVRRFSKIIQFENIVTEARRRQRHIPAWRERKEKKDVWRREKRRHLSAKRRQGFKRLV